MSKSKNPTRRTFIKSAAAVAGATVVAGMAGCAQSKPARYKPGAERKSLLAPRRDKLRVAFIGTGGMGGSHLETTKDLGIVCPCYCDVDTNRMGKAAELYPDAKAYQDYRVMYEKEADNFDAVMIGIPDHHHYPATILAMQLGKHVYTQKPLTHTPWEARKLAEAAAKYQVATQMGNQGHAGNGWRLVYEFVHSGAIGEITEVHSWTDRPIWPQAMERPEGEDAVPANLDWDLWLGPAQKRPYKGPANGKGAGPYHWFNWRGWWDFGAGALGDMACHVMDGVFWVLDPAHPTSVEPMAVSRMTKEAFPKAAAIKWEFPATKKHRPFNAYWYDGGLFPQVPAELEIGRRLPDNGNIFIGTKGAMLVSGAYGNSPRIIPETKMKEIGKPPKMLDRSPGHAQEWIMAARGEKPLDYPKSNFFYAGPFTETILLGNIALRVGRRLDWDGEKMQFTNCPEANQYVSKEYRAGWKF